MDVVKQSAALCLLRLFRTSQEIIPGGEWTSRIIHLLNDQHMGVVTAATSLIDALVKKNPEEYKGCVSLAVSRLSRVSENILCIEFLVFHTRFFRSWPLVIPIYKIIHITLYQHLGCRWNCCVFFKTIPRQVIFWKFTHYRLKYNFFQLKTPGCVVDWTNA